MNTTTALARIQMSNRLRQKQLCRVAKNPRPSVDPPRQTIYRSVESHSNRPLPRKRLERCFSPPPSNWRHFSSCRCAQEVHNISNASRLSNYVYHNNTSIIRRSTHLECFYFFSIE